MLNNSYSDYVWTIFLTGLDSIFGWAGIGLIFAFVISLFAPAVRDSNFRGPIYWTLSLGALLFLTTSFYTAVYVFDEHPDELIAEFSLDTSNVCGSGVTPWWKAGYGFGNPCPSDCSKRGLTLRKEMRMTGFPPWPEYRKELQCSRR